MLIENMRNSKKKIYKWKTKNLNLKYKFHQYWFIGWNKRKPLDRYNHDRYICINMASMNRNFTEIKKNFSKKPKIDLRGNSWSRNIDLCNGNVK